MQAVLQLRVGRLELDAPLEVVLLDRVDQSEDPIGNEIRLFDVGRQTDGDATGDVLDQRRVVEDQALTRIDRCLELELLPQPTHGRRLVQRSPPFGRPALAEPVWRLFPPSGRPDPHTWRRATTAGGSGTRLSVRVDPPYSLVQDRSGGLGGCQGNV